MKANAIAVIGERMPPLIWQYDLSLDQVFILGNESGYRYVTWRDAVVFAAEQGKKDASASIRTN
jgi:hypothetical protein